MRDRLYVSNRVGTLFRSFICEEEKGQFRKGLLMQHAERALLRYIAEEKGLLEREVIQNTRTQKSSKSNKLLVLRDSIVSYLGVGQFKEQEVLETIKIVEDLTDDRPAKDRLGLLIRSHQCTETKSPSGMRLIKFIGEPASKIKEAPKISLEEQKRIDTILKPEIMEVMR